jgi:peptide/nickel transport system permease protein
MATVSVPIGTPKSSASTVKAETQLELVTRRFFKHRLAVISLILLLAILVASLLAPLIASFERDEGVTTSRFLPVMSTDPATGRTHILGTTDTGKDIFTLLLYGARVTLTTAIFVASLSTFIGIVIGALAGFYRGVIDTMLMRFLEFMSSIPTSPILLILSSILIRDPDLLPFPQWLVSSIKTIMLLRTDQEATQVCILLLVLTAFGWLGVARLMRGEVLRLREMEFVSASRSLGVSDIGLIARHIVPNGLAPIIVAYTAELASAFAAETVLSFLGFGLQDPIPTWGNLLAYAEGFIFEQKTLLLKVAFPALICSLAFNFIGDGLRDALDPRLKM